MTRVKKTRRYEHEGLIASVGESRDDLPSTDRSQFAAIHRQGMEFDAAIATRLRDAKWGSWAYGRTVILMCLVMPLIFIVAAFIAHSL